MDGKSKGDTSKVQSSAHGHSSPPKRILYDYHGRHHRSIYVVFEEAHMDADFATSASKTHDAYWAIMSVLYAGEVVMHPHRTPLREGFTGPASVPDNHGEGAIQESGREPVGKVSALGRTVTGANQEMPD
eukprot:44886-Eustigmatos_ZCMA.PRE.1